MKQQVSFCLAVVLATLAGGAAALGACLSLSAQTGGGLYLEPARQGDPHAQFLMGRMYCLGAGVTLDQTQAARWFRLAADQGDADAQCELGWCYQIGAGVEKSPLAARNWYRLAAAQGHAQAFSDLAGMEASGSDSSFGRVQAYTYRLLAMASGDWLAEYSVYGYGRHLPADLAASGQKAARTAMRERHPLAASLPQPAGHSEPPDENLPSTSPGSELLADALKGTAESQYRLGLMYTRGEDVRQDPIVATRWFLLAAAQGHPRAQYEVGQAHRFGNGVRSSAPVAVDWLRKAAGQGVVDAQIELARLLAEGRDGAAGVVPKDLAEAARWFRQAEDRGDPEALTWLGRILSQVAGEAQDLAAAARCYRKAAEMGYAKAQFQLGRVLDAGIGVPQDFVEAAGWYRKAAGQGDADAQYNLATLYAEGQGVPKDAGEARKWFAAAAEPRPEDHPQPPTLIKQMRSRTVRVAKDPVKAYAFFLVAQRCGNPEAPASLSLLEKSLSGNQRAEGRNKADAAWNAMGPD